MSEGEQEFARLMADPVLTLSKRGRALLTYLMDAKSRGKTSVDPREIALNVLDRGRDFSPTSDPIVRIEVGRLRAALKNYYELNGATSTCIVIATRNYIPNFGYREIKPLELNPKIEIGPPSLPTTSPARSDLPPTFARVEFYTLVIGSVFVMITGVLLAVAVIW
jgi:hypothetical protein